MNGESTGQERPGAAGAEAISEDLKQAWQAVAGELNRHLDTSFDLETSQETWDAVANKLDRQGHVDLAKAIRQLYATKNLLGESEVDNNDINKNLRRVRHLIEEYKAQAVGGEQAGSEKTGETEEIALLRADVFAKARQIPGLEQADSMSFDDLNKFIEKANEAGNSKLESIAFLLLQVRKYSNKGSNSEPKKVKKYLEKARESLASYGAGEVSEAQPPEDQSQAGSVATENKSTGKASVPPPTPQSEPAPTQSAAQQIIEGAQASVHGLDADANRASTQAFYQTAGMRQQPHADVSGEETVAANELNSEADVNMHLAGEKPGVGTDPQTEMSEADANVVFAKEGVADQKEEEPLELTNVISPAETISPERAAWREARAEFQAHDAHFKTLKAEYLSPEFGANRLAYEKAMRESRTDIDGDATKFGQMSRKIHAYKRAKQEHLRLAQAQIDAFAKVKSAERDHSLSESTPTPEDNQARANALLAHSYVVGLRRSERGTVTQAERAAKPQWRQQMERKIGSALTSANGWWQRRDKRVRMMIAYGATGAVAAGATAATGGGVWAAAGGAIALKTLIGGVISPVVAGSVEKMYGALLTNKRRGALEKTRQTFGLSNIDALERDLERVRKSERNKGYTKFAAVVGAGAAVGAYDDEVWGEAVRLSDYFTELPESNGATVDVSTDPHTSASLLEPRSVETNQPPEVVANQPDVVAVSSQETTAAAAGSPVEISRAADPSLAVASSPAETAVGTEATTITPTGPAEAGSAGTPAAAESSASAHVMATPSPETASAVSGETSSAAVGGYEVRPGDTVSGLLFGEGSGRELSSVLENIPPEHRQAAITELINRANHTLAGQEMLRAAGIESGDVNVIYRGDEINLEPIEEALSNIAQENGWDTGAAGANTPTGTEASSSETPLPPERPAAPGGPAEGPTPVGFQEAIESGTAQTQADQLVVDIVRSEHFTVEPSAIDFPALNEVVMGGENPPTTWAGYREAVTSLVEREAVFREVLGGAWDGDIPSQQLQQLETVRAGDLFGAGEVNGPADRLRDANVFGENEKIARGLANIIWETGASAGIDPNMTLGETLTQLSRQYDIIARDGAIVIESPERTITFRPENGVFTRVS